jgi:hypothetical protein
MELPAAVKGLDPEGLAVGGEVNPGLLRIQWGVGDGRKPHEDAPYIGDFESRG